jgi:predicted anti-sigma-YlaC factor YlaD
MMRPVSPCDRHRPALLDLVDRGERGAATDPALDHLAVCGACEQELTQVALAVHALRRVGREVRAVPVPVVPAERVAGLAVRRREAWSWRLQLGSIAASAAIVAVVVAPRVGVGPSPAYTDSLMPDRPAAIVTPWRAAEARIAASPDSPSVSAPSATGTLPPRYPEGLTRPWKEVLPSDAAPREFIPS